MFSPVIHGPESPARNANASAIEDALGAPLFARTTRSVALTDAGERFLAAITPALAAIDVSVQVTGPVRVTPGLFLYFPRNAANMPKLRAFIDVAREILRPRARTS